MQGDNENNILLLETTKMAIKEAENYFKNKELQYNNEIFKLQERLEWYIQNYEQVIKPEKEDRGKINKSMKSLWKIVKLLEDQLKENQKIINELKTTLSSRNPDSISNLIQQVNPIQVKWIIK